jgi:uncharacterized protein YpuA (DUF1002 family)
MYDAWYMERVIRRLQTTTAAPHVSGSGAILGLYYALDTDSGITISLATARLLLHTTTEFTAFNFIPT